MTKYQVEVVNQTVHQWNNDHGQGDYVCSKGGFEIGTYPTLDEAKKAINDYFGYELDSDAYEDDHIMATQIENYQAHRDPNGGFMVDYYLCVNKIDKVVFKPSGLERGGLSHAGV